MQMPRPKTLLLISVCTAILTILLKMGAWYLTGSVGFLSDGLESFVNLAGAVFALLMVTIAERPADADHPHGHHKAEYFSSGFEGVLIFAAAMGILWTSIDRLIHPQPLQQISWGLVLSILSTILNGLVAWILLRAAKLHHSIALEADGKHLRTDVYTSIGVMAGIGLVMLSGWQWLDPVVAILVALNILREGWELIHKSSQGLMDRAVSAEVSQLIHDTLRRFETRDMQNHPEVCFDHLVTRAAGMRNFASMHLHLPSSWTLGEAAELRNEVEKALIAVVPMLHTTIELMPRNLEPVQVLLSTPLHGTITTVSEQAPARSSGGGRAGVA
jgi:cation diffusion facilitator family transporter